MFSKLTKFSIKNSVTTILLCILVLGLGIFSSQSIKIETYPDFAMPTLMINTVYPGASAEEVEKNVTKEIEDSLSKGEEYDSLTSTSSDNSSVVFISYPFDKDIDDASSELEQTLSKLKLPQDAEYTVEQLAMNSVPIYQVALYSDDKDVNVQEALENKIVPDLEKLDGVSSINLKGEKTQDLSILVDEGKADDKGIDITAIENTIKNQEYDMPLKSIKQDDGSTALRLSGTIQTVDELKNLKVFPGTQSQNNQPQNGTAQGGKGSMGQSNQGGNVAQNADAEPVLLKDVAEVKQTNTQEEIVRYDKKPGFLLEVVKTQDANTTDVVAEVEKEMEDYIDDYNLDMHIVSNQGEEITKSITTTIKEGLLGALFTIIVIAVFLRNFRATVIALFSLPLSIFVTIYVLELFGYTLNIMTLGGLVVAIGRIVDDSIVVIENIYRWKQDKGNQYSQRELVLKATNEVGSAVASSTLATVVVFLPLAFVGGIPGEMFRPFSISVVVSILASLFVAFMLIPLLGNKFFNKVQPHEKESRLVNTYERVLRKALKRRKIVFVAAGVLLAGSLALIPLFNVTFLPSGKATSLNVDVTLPATSTLESTDKVAKKVEEYLLDVKDVTYVQGNIGTSEGRGPESQGAVKKNKALFTMGIEEDTDIEALIESSKEDIDEIITKDAGKDSIVTITENQDFGPPSGTNLDIQLYSSNFEDLRKASKEVEDMMKDDDRLKDISNDFRDLESKWNIQLNQKARDEGISYSQIMSVVNQHIGTSSVGTYTIDKEEQEILLGFNSQVVTEEQLKGISFSTSDGTAPIGDYIEVEKSQVPVTIQHDDGKAYATVSGTLDEGSISEVTADAKEDIDDMSLPSSVDVEVGGGQELINDGFTDIGIAIVIAIGLVFIVMSLTFGGLLTPIIILTSLIFVPIGSLTALLILQQPLSLSVMIGFLMLIGIVVTNAVVLLDRVETNRASGMKLTDSIIEAAKIRIRPIIMTAFATIFALIPMAFSTSTSGVISKGLAITVIGGLTTSTLLTLIFIPVVYHTFGKYRKFKVESISNELVNKQVTQMDTDTNRSYEKDNFVEKNMKDEDYRHLLAKLQNEEESIENPATRSNDDMYRDMLRKLNKEDK